MTIHIKGKQTIEVAVFEWKKQCIRTFLSTAILTLFCCCLPTNARAQTGGIPHFRYYSGKEIGSDKPIFSIAKDKDGLIYLAIADEQRIIVYDGERWEDISIPQRPWSLSTDTRGVVWASLEDRIGYFSKNELGTVNFQQFSYTDQSTNDSLFPFSFPTAKGIRFGNPSSFLEVDTSGAEIVSKLTRGQVGESFIAFDGEEVISLFEASNAMYRFHGVERIPLPGPFDQRFNYAMPIDLGTYLFVSETWSSLLVRQDDRWQPFSVELEKRANHSDFEWVARLSRNRVGCAGTDGFFCCKTDGQLLYHIDKNSGLPSSRVICFGEFDDGRIWLALAEGFAILSNQSGQDRFPFDVNANPSIYSIATLPSEILTTTTSGVYRIELDRVGRGESSILTNIDVVPHVDLIRSGDHMLMSGPKGIFEVNGGKEKLLWQKETTIASEVFEGVFCVHRVGGKYSVLKFDGEKISELASFQIPFLSNGILLARESTIWIYGYGSNLAAVSYRKGWDEEPEIAILENDKTLGYAFIDSEVHMLTSNGYKKPELVHARVELRDAPKLAFLQKQMQHRQRVTRLVECGQFGLLVCSKQGITLHARTEDGFESEPSGIWAIQTTTSPVAWDPERRVAWTVSGNSLVSIDITHPTIPILSKPNIRVTIADQTKSESSKNEPLKSAGMAATGGRFQLNSSDALRFDYSVPSNISNGELQLQCRLEGLEDWSGWSSETRKEYARLPGGSYRFCVRARDFVGRYSESSTGWFQVPTPWHQTWVAYLTYSTLGLGAVYFVVALRTHRLELANLAMKTLVNERTEAAEALRKSEERFTAFMDNGPFIAWVQDSQGRYESFRRRGQGKTGADFPNNEHTDFLPAQVTLDHHGVNSQVSDTGNPISFETSQLLPTGETRHLFVVMFPFRLDEHETRIGGIAVDRTEQRRAELERDRFFETSSDLMCVVSASGRFKRVNQAFTSILGFASTELQTLDFIGLVHPNDILATEAAINRVKTGTRTIQFENRYLCRDRSYRLIAWTISSQDTDADISYAVGRDITEHRSLEQSLLQAVDNEQRRIAHDLHDGLGQELAGMTMMAESLAKILEAQSSSESLLAKKIAIQLDASLQLTRSLARGLRPIEIDEHGLASALSQLADHVSEMYRVDCSFHGDADFNLIDPQKSTHLYRIAQEAVTNAAKHSRSKSIDIYLTELSGVLELKVVDLGIGIVGESVLREGIGMKSMRYRSDLIGGELRVESGEAGGTSVICRLNVDPS